MRRPKTRTVKLEDVVIDQRAQTRADGLDDAHVSQMVDDLKELPPMLVVDVNGKLMLADGFHRHAAYKRAKMLRVPVAVVVGSEDDWVDAFASANDGQKGKPRTREDKRNAVRRCLELRPKWSNRRVAEAAKVGDQLVRQVRDHAPETHQQGGGQLRDHAVQDGESDPDQLRTNAVEEPAKREGKDGKLRPATMPKPLKTQPETPTEPTTSAPETDDTPTPAVVETAPPTPASEPVIQPEQPANDDPEQINTADPSEQFCDTLKAICRDLDAIGQRVATLKESAYGRFVHWQSAKDQIKNGRETLWQGQPNYHCPYCKVAGEVQSGCRCCGGLNVCTKQSYKAGVASVGGGDQ